MEIPTMIQSVYDMDENVKVSSHVLAALICVYGCDFKYSFSRLPNPVLKHFFGRNTRVS